jgi:transaldolase/glucose-6-phosphate isomerase
MAEPSSRAGEAAGEGGELELLLPEDVGREVDRWLARAVDEGVAGRVWRRDAGLWGPPGAPEVGDRLGWLDAPTTSLGQVGEIEAFVAECRAEGIRDVVLLGMGGSSLAPEVVRRSLAAAGGPTPGAPRLTVLDSVDPDAVAAVEASTDFEHALFLVSTKSGGTIETLSLARRLLATAQRSLGTERPGRSFVAITDPGGTLLDLAHEWGFRRAFLGDPEIGGRFSALSVFGTVPAALAGTDLRVLLAGAEEGRRLCAAERLGADNVGVRLGVAMGALALLGRDKLGFVIDEPLGGLGLWLEQLVAESTGKDGRGIVPVVDEPLEAARAGGDDRAVVAVGAQGGGAHRRAEELAALGHPALSLAGGGVSDLGRLFFLFEFATAVAGWVLEVNPFDQPSVEEAKVRTRALLDGGGARRTEPADATTDPALAARDLFAAAAPPEYVAVLIYAPLSDGLDRAAERLRTAVAARTGAAATVGYGPRYLHSTGQLHKGGPPTGRFLVLVRAPREPDLEVPDAGYGFGELLLAQAGGDLEALRARGRPAVRIELAGDPVAALDRLAEAVSVETAA